MRFFCWSNHRHRSVSGSPVQSAKSSYSQSPYYIWAILAIFPVLVLLVRHSTKRDPTSWFFDPESGYEPHYSNVRRQQADNFVQDVFHNSTATYAKFNARAGSSAMCVGIATIARDNVRYFRSAVGSLLAGLDHRERQRIFLILFITYSNPEVHPAFNEGWVEKLAYRVLLYNTSQVETQMIQHLESQSGEYRKKPLFDYSFLLRSCLDTNSSYIAILEDDVLAMDGWLHRTKRALQDVEKKTADRGYADFLYLRLFYTEEYLGWNSEEWPRYTALSLLVLVIATGLTYLLYSLIPTARHSVESSDALRLSAVCVILFILLFFAAGRITALPLHVGINEMNNFGCCSQGFVFSRTMAEKLIDWYREKEIGFVDMLTEEFGNRYGFPRWAFTPSVLQHVGRTTSKNDGTRQIIKYGRTAAELLWNFAYEMYDPAKLTKEHTGMLETML